MSFRSFVRRPVRRPRLRVRTAPGQAEALVLNCFDFRLTDKVTAYLASRGLGGRYDQVVLAGASLGATTSRFPAWGQTFFEQLDLAIKLHGVRRVIAIDHRDCRAYALISGKSLTGGAEIEQHATELHRFARAVHAKHPALAVETYLMALDGTVETIS